MKQTAVEWLVEQWPILESQIPERILDEALAMEKQQIIEAYEYTAIGTSNYGEQYYKKTYESNT
jgi:hypothetical protein